VDKLVGIKIKNMNERYRGTPPNRNSRNNEPARPSNPEDEPPLTMRRLLNDSLPLAREARVEAIKETLPDDDETEKTLEIYLAKKEKGEPTYHYEPGFPIADDDKADFDYAVERIIANTTPEKRETDEMSEVMEAIILDQTDTNSWLCSSRDNDFKMHPSHICDDVLRGTDLYLEYREDEETPYGLAIDVTFSSREKIEDKIKRIIKRIKNGTLTELSYVPRENEDGDFEATQITKIPTVILSCDAPRLMELMNLWSIASRPRKLYTTDKEEKNALLDLENELISKRQDSSKAKKIMEETKKKYLEEIDRAKATLKTHEIQMQLLYEAESQLKIFIQIALSSKRQNTAKAFELRLRKIEEAIAQKKQDNPEFSDLSYEHFYQTDRTFKNIMDILEEEAKYIIQ